MTYSRTNTPFYSLFYVFSWLHILYEAFPFFADMTTGLEPIRDYAFNLMAYGSYSFIYLLPAIILITLMRFFFESRLRTMMIISVALSLVSLLLVFADQIIYDLFRFHFNSFVVNLIFTPGGIESLGASDDSYTGFALVAVRMLSVQIAVWYLSVWLVVRFSSVKIILRGLLVVFFVSVLGERILYGLSDAQNYGTILESSRAYPFYKKTTFKTFAKKIGIDVKRQDKLKVQSSSNRLRYPLKPVVWNNDIEQYNIVILMAESLRGDRLTSEIMPKSWNFAQQVQHFKHHYSSGNGTREGMFGFFYGLPGSYWSSFLYAQQSPLLMQRLLELGYQHDFRTSAHFSYPEFDKTIFADFPMADLYEAPSDIDPVARDEKNITGLIDFMENRDRDKPFVSFMFFESTHARYSFPDSAKIFTPVLEKLDYSSMSRKKLRPYAKQLLNRYSNSAHWVDHQVGRVFEYLTDNNMLDNTIVIFSGDHGEEFMEHGFWGHNSSFVQAQIETPLLVSYPGMGAGVIERTTSHMDISVLLMRALGATNLVGDYAIGQDLFNDEPRPYIITSDWHSIGIITPDFKYRIPYTNEVINYPITTPGDQSMTPEQQHQIRTEHRHLLLDALQDISRFKH